MLTRRHRFHGLGSLNFVYRRGRTVRGKHMALRFVLNERRSEYRAAVVVSRKVNKSAVVRNRIRRRLYEQLRLQLPDNLEPYDLVLTVFSDRVAEEAPVKLRRDVKQLLKEAGLIK